MLIDIHTKGIDLDSRQREYFDNAIGKIGTKYFSKPVRASLTLSPEGQNTVRARLMVRVGGSAGDANAYGDGPTAARATQQAIERVAKQLRRKKRRLHEDH